MGWVGGGDSERASSVCLTRHGQTRTHTRRQTDTQTHGQTKRQTKRQTTARPRDRHTARPRDRHTDTQTKRQTHRQTHRPRDRHTDRQSHADTQRRRGHRGHRGQRCCQSISKRGGVVWWEVGRESVKRRGCCVCCSAPSCVYMYDTGPCWFGQALSEVGLGSLGKRVG